MPLNAPYKGNHKRITEGCYDRQDEAAELYALSCLLYQDDPDDSADLYTKLPARGNLFAFAGGTVLAGGAVLFFDKAELYLHSVFAPIDPLSALPESNRMLLFSCKAADNRCGDWR